MTPIFHPLHVNVYYKNNTVNTEHRPKTLHTYIHSAWSSQRGRQEQRWHNRCCNTVGIKWVKAAGQLSVSHIHQCQTHGGKRTVWLGLPLHTRRWDTHQKEQAGQSVRTDGKDVSGGSWSWIISHKSYTFTNKLGFHALNVCRLCMINVVNQIV